MPEVLKKKVVYSLDMGKLLAGTRYRGDFEERMQHVLEALEERDDAILFIDEIHMIMGAGAGGGGGSFPNRLRRHRGRWGVRCYLAMCGRQSLPSLRNGCPERGVQPCRQSDHRNRHDHELHRRDGQSDAWAGAGNANAAKSAIAACTVEKRFIEVPKVTAPVKSRVVPMGLQGEPEGIGSAS